MDRQIQKQAWSISIERYTGLKTKKLPSNDGSFFAKQINIFTF
ncbi:hypothetical protein NC99_13080 [Sunxiuqinia dokdonensis]|uniref:Uncharacterized protein n=1 Tax=Sunxiuqinia dokdonensis TaxID=1409788 RepID=A0A0L8VBP2_9BACT|nr:hypothetical protein NC99_13080 [Sunxiuqinia dokdonensis]